MKYQTNAVGHRVGASELPTRHPRHKPRRRFPLPILPRSSKLLQDISLFLLSLPLPPSRLFHLLFLLVFFFYFNVLHFFAASIYIFLFFFYFSFPCPIEQSPHFFLMFSSLCLKITSLKTPGCVSATSRILDELILDFIVLSVANNL